MAKLTPMRIDLPGLIAFVAIAERGSFGRAAAHLNLSQTALSHRMRKLEEDLGVTLLSRTTRQISLTPAGLDLLPKLKATIDDLSTSLAKIREGGSVRQTELCIGCLPSVAGMLLAPILRKFQAAHPDVILRLYDQSADDLDRLVHAGTVEFAVTILAAHGWDIDLEPLMKDPFVLVCPEDHPLARLSVVQWSDLADVPLVRTKQQGRIFIDDALGSRRESTNWRFEVQYIQTAVAFVRARLGLTVLPRFSVDEGGAHGLRLIPLRNPTVTRLLGIIGRRGVPLSPLAEELKTLILKSVPKRARETARAASP